MFFGPDCVRGQILGNLVRLPLQNYARLLGRDGYLTTHLQSPYHENAVDAMNAWKKQVEMGTKNIEQQLNKKADDELKSNRAIITRILYALEYHGRLGLPLRGHRDFGDLPIPDSLESGQAMPSNAATIDFTQGNFRSTLQFMIGCDDQILRQHCQHSARNSTYISPLAQNQLIDSIQTHMQEQIINELSRTKFFSMLADETTDFSRQEQLTVCLRYLTPDDRLLERFLCFAVAPDLTGKGLCDKLMGILAEMNVDTSYMIGQGYDGAAAMSGEWNGVQKHVQDVCSSAIYVHCASHSLNLCLVKASEIPAIKACVTLMQSIAVFFTDSNKRLADLQKAIKENCPESNRTRLLKHCSTRWVEKQTAIQVFKDLYPAVVASLQRISGWRDNGSGSGRALIFLRSFDSDFHVSLQILNVVLAVTKPLSSKLQGVSQDLAQAVNGIQECVDVLESFRNDDTFDKAFQRAAETLGEELVMPRRAGRQTQRNNVPADTPLQYYKRAIFLPYIDTVVGQLKARFQGHSAVACKLIGLLPAFCVTQTFASIEESVDLYQKFLPDDSDRIDVQAEFKRWSAYWARKPEGDRPDRPLNALQAAVSAGTFPCIAILLRIFCCLPVTTASGERTFSALKYIKSYLRSTMTEDRLNGLAHMFINKDIRLDYERVIDIFSKSNRRLKLR